MSIIQMMEYAVADFKLPSAYLALGTFFLEWHYPMIVEPSSIMLLRRLEKHSQQIANFLMLPKR